MLVYDELLLNGASCLMLKPYALLATQTIHYRKPTPREIVIYVLCKLNVLMRCLMTCVS